MLVATSAASFYVLIRTPVPFETPDEDTIQSALDSTRDTASGRRRSWSRRATRRCSSTATAGSACIAPSGLPGGVFGSGRAVPRPSAAGSSTRSSRYAADLDRRPLFYQVSLDWVPLLHDRGYHFFKLGEEAQVPLERVTLEGHAGKMTRQILRRAERDGVAFRILAPPESTGPRRAAEHLRRLAAREGGRRAAVLDRLLR